MSEVLKVMTGVGRIVQGHPMMPMEKTDRMTKQPKLNADGSKQIQYWCSLAFPKTDPTFANQVYPLIQQAAQRDWPGGQYNSPKFAWKWYDADTTMDEQGKPYSAREGMAGCYVLKIGSSYAYTVVDAQGNRISDPRQLKTGDYARAFIGIKGNNPSQTPGLYINPDFLQVCGYGAEINRGPDVSAVLAQVGGFALPAGASAMPVAPQMQPAMPGMPAPGLPTYAPPAAAPAYAPPVAAPMAPAMPQVGTVQHGNGAPIQPVYAPHPGILQPPR